MFSEKYGDIIYFYNNIYVEKMRPFALQFREIKDTVSLKYKSIIVMIIHPVFITIKALS